MEGERPQREVRRFPVRVEIHLQREEAAVARSRGGGGGVEGSPEPRAARLGRPGAATPPSRRLVGVNQTRQWVEKSAAGRQGGGRAVAREHRQCCRDTRPSSVAETQEQRAAPVRPELARRAA